MSPFGATSTAAEVAAGHDLSGKRVIVTGANSGIGVETAVTLASVGAEVVLAVRDPVSAEPVLDRIAAAGGKAYASALELSDLRSVEAFVSREKGQPLHSLINNAGIMACPFARTAQGFEAQIGVNHLGHFHLTTLMLPDLIEAGGSRVVSVSSSGHHWSAFDFDDPHFETEQYDPIKAYGRSKTANALFAVELDRRYREHGVRAFSLMPGAIQTNLGRSMTDEIRKALGVDAASARQFTWKTPEQGAATSIWAALGHELEGLGGLYLENCDVAALNEPGRSDGVKPWAIDPVAAKLLWAWSEAAIEETI
ncbi:SDR family NAD(P)-dependent oxidoreductase [Novosphingobium taihuense]|uniref:Probable oxidoreductase n=1 Tax=Novosphingobium taihuense TaxID=260085 RepID=A0A7W7AEK0_9SPHN|nr:SDR family NAD(P)-dependent oxidoreductase [Novosphingobium taihuense]MBB4615416.1 NAD(P)-dependent dehydrogenase (short-subunit alcohol dehydrogenase family) [Novosphingobium taihuense]TWH82136.1 NAD(P)-dependent dehydrogenase (short-subunit alcohol dehydrogenase family) [Novosphingobium taihuense]